MYGRIHHAIPRCDGGVEILVLICGGVAVLGTYFDERGNGYSMHLLLDLIAIIISNYNVSENAKCFEDNHSYIS